MAFAIVGAEILLDTDIVDGQAVVVDGRRITGVFPVDDLPPNVERREAHGTLAPGFIDVQVNGGGGVLFNESRSVEGIRAIGAAHRRFGTTGFLPTFMTDTRAKMIEAIAAVREGMAAGVPGLLGIHLEGPFLNPDRKGVHEPKFMRPVEAEDIRIMTSLGIGRTMVTLAPEMVELKVISQLTAAGVIVMAGHTAADPDTLAEARRRGLAGYTHLFNAMPPLMGREPGPVGAALIDDEAWCTLIVDLQHVSVVSMQVALAARGIKRLLLITDAMPTAGADQEGFELHGRTIFRRDGRLTTADGTLAGADLDMATAVRNCVQSLGLAKAVALRMASLAPATLLRLDDELGRIAPGYRASLVLLDDALNVHRSWIDGVERSAVE